MSKMPTAAWKKQICEIIHLAPYPGTISNSNAPLMIKLAGAIFSISEMETFNLHTNVFPAKN